MRTLRLNLLVTLLVTVVGLQACTPQKPSNACAPRDLGSLSGWSGVWLADGMDAGISGRPEPGSDSGERLAEMAGAKAPWNDAGILRVEDMLRLTIPGNLKQAGWAFPVMMNTFAPLAFVIAPQETLIVNSYREVRHVYTDGRQHAPEDERWSTPWGDSVGCWNGDTLTIDTVSAGYNPRFSYYAPPLSDDAHFVEKLRMVAPDRIDSEMTITDPATLLRPWIIRIAYVREKQVDRLVHDGDMFENDRSELQGNSLTIAPPRPAEQPAPIRPEIKPTAAELDRLVGDYANEAPPIVFHVERRDGYIWMGPDPIRVLPLHASDPHNFYSGATDLAVHFRTDASGKIASMDGHGPEGPFNARKVAAPAPDAQKPKGAN